MEAAFAFGNNLGLTAAGNSNKIFSYKGGLDKPVENLTREFLNFLTAILLVFRKRSSSDCESDTVAYANFFQSYNLQLKQPCCSSFAEYFILNFFNYIIIITKYLVFQ